MDSHYAPLGLGKVVVPVMIQALGACNLESRNPENMNPSELVSRCVSNGLAWQPLLMLLHAFVGAIEAHVQDIVGSSFTVAKHECSKRTRGTSQHRSGTPEHSKSRATTTAAAAKPFGYATSSAGFSSAWTRGYGWTQAAQQDATQRFHDGSRWSAAAAAAAMGE